MVASPEVPVRMLKADFSSAISSPATQSPCQAHPDQHEAGRGVSGILRRGGTMAASGKGGRGGRGQGGLFAPVRAAVQAVGAARMFWLPDISSCCTQMAVSYEPREFRGIHGARRRPPRGQSSIELQWLGAHRPRRCRACGIAERAEQRGRRRGNRIRHGGPLATALFELAREQNAIDTVKVESRPV